MIKIWDIQEKYRTLRLYDCAVEQQEVDDAFLVSRPATDARSEASQFRCS